MKLKQLETGLKTIQKSNSLNKHNNKALSIQISLSGLSFCILDVLSNTIEHLKCIPFEKKATPFEVLERLITVLNTNTIFEQAFQSVLVIYQNELSCCVPKPLFDEEHSADYLKFNAKILHSDFIAHDDITINNSVNVYVPFVNINNYIFDRFGDFVYKHASTLLIQSLLQKEIDSKDAKLYVNVSNTHFEVVAIDKGQFVFYNTFEYQTKEDFIYYILFAIEQLKLSPETIHTKLMGDLTKDDERFAIAYKYIRFVEFIEPFHSYKFGDKHQPETHHSNYIILNSFD
ncbi:DUF3822 family protein [Flavobacteriaceae bacterium LMO-SS05]